MHNLWAPWRINYILNEKEEGCIFCIKPKQIKDRENLILFRGKTAFIIMNKYPYNSGHLMVVPYTHKESYENLTDEELLEINKLIQVSIKVLKKKLSPHGFNLGVNLGKVSGAGIDEHIHFHIVPRWEGDTNFMPVFADCRVIPQSLTELYDILKGDFENEIY